MLYEVDGNECGHDGNAIPEHAGKASKFTVKYEFKDCNIILFWSVYRTGKEYQKDSKPLIPVVQEYKEYVLPKNINSVPIENSVTRNGKKSGVLVIPYKLRNDDGALTGGATVGYYFGWEHRDITTLLSAGLSRISVKSNSGSTTDETALTIATGLILNNWDNVDVGLIVGLDHIGGAVGKSWQYEDDPWISFMVGWNFSH